MPRPVESPLDRAWAAVYLRHHQLGILDARILELEGVVRRLFDSENRLRVDESFGERLDEEHEAAPEFALQGESGFMFAEAALNCLAEAVAQSRDPTGERDRSDSFLNLKRSVEQPSDEVTRRLGSLLPKMRAANVPADPQFGTDTLCRDNRVMTSSNRCPARVSTARVLRVGHGGSTRA